MNIHDKKAYSISEFAKAVSLGKTKIYEEIKYGRLKTCKVGRRTIITTVAAEEWLRLIEEKTD